MKMQIIFSRIILLISAYNADSVIVDTANVGAASIATASPARITWRGLG